MRLNLIPNLEEKRPKTEVSLARAPWEQPSTDRSETAPRGRSYMVSTPRAQEPVEPSSIIATLRAVVEARA